MEKLGQLAQSDEWDLVVVDTPPSRNALDFLDAPQRLGAFLDGRMIRMLSAPGRGHRASGHRRDGHRRSRASRRSWVARCCRTRRRSCSRSTPCSAGSANAPTGRISCSSSPAPSSWWCVAAEPDALREAAFFVDRLGEDRMPLAGLVLNRTHPTLSGMPADHALTAADALAERGRSKTRRLTEAVLRIHAHRAVTAKRELHLLQQLHRRASRGARSWGFPRCRSRCRISRRCAPWPISSPARPEPLRGGRCQTAFWC